MTDCTSLNASSYQACYEYARDNPIEFWGEQAAKTLSWFNKWDNVISGNLAQANVSWFSGATLNACYNCVDRHLTTQPDKIAIIWEGDEPGETRKISYRELHADVCRFANVLKQLGIRKGDRICLYLPMIPEIAVAMLACARIGAIHSVIFSGFAAQSLQTRILDANAQLVITTDEGIRGGKMMSTKATVDQALQACPQVKNVLVIKRTGNEIPWQKGRDIWLHEALKTVDAECVPTIMAATDPLFILYTSGSTGKPKGIVHSTAGYLLYTALTYRYLFDYRDTDIHWCTADAGWITGHSYLLYGPLATGATTLMYEGTPHYPNYGRYWSIIDQHQVTVFYTSPTAIRLLRREGDTWPQQAALTSLRLLGSVGEPINPEVWTWYYNIIGKKRCSIIDTWWQTETGGILIAPVPGFSPLKPGAAARPFLGISPAIVDEQGQPITDHTPGRLVITYPWPGIMQTVYGDRTRFVDTYFKDIPGCYLTGDLARQDEAGDFYILGRHDDVIKVSGHRFGTEELESAFLTHPDVSEAAVIGVPDEIRGECIYAYITLKTGMRESTALREALVAHVAETLGPVARPQMIQWAAELPKTRSGKIMRRVLRKIAVGEFTDLGDLSTLVNPEVVTQLIEQASHQKTP